MAFLSFFVLAGLALGALAISVLERREDRAAERRSATGSVPVHSAH